MLYASTIGTVFHIKHRSRDAIVDEDSLLQFFTISTQGIKKSDRILMLSSPLDDITRHAWRVSQILQFHITDLGISIEFCPNCFKTHIPQYRSFNLFVHTSVLNVFVDFICKNTQAVAIDEFNSFITIYRLQNHQCLMITPPNTPPPPSPTIDSRPIIPSRNHPRFGYLRGPHAMPFPKISDTASPYKITNRIVINNDGSISQESTILGYHGSMSNSDLQKPPRKCGNAQLRSEKLQPSLQQNVVHHPLCRNTSGGLLPPKYIKRKQAPPPKNIPRHIFTHPTIDTDVDNEDDYEINWLLEDYIKMSSRKSITSPQLAPIVGDYQMGPRNSENAPQLSHTVGDHMSSHGANQNNVSVHVVNELSTNATHSIASSNGSHSVSVDVTSESDLIDRDYINIQNILIELDKSVSKSRKPPIKKRTFRLLKTEVDLNVTLGYNQPQCVPRNSTKSSASPKPTPRKRTIKFDFSMLSREEDKDTTHSPNGTSKVVDDLMTQSNNQYKLQTSPKLPIRNASNMESCDISFVAENNSLVTTTQQSHFPLG